MIVAGYSAFGQRETTHCRACRNNIDIRFQFLLLFQEFIHQLLYNQSLSDGPINHYVKSTIYLEESVSLRLLPTVNILFYI